MKRLALNSVFRFLRDEDGPTSVEYAVMIMLVIGVVVTSVQLLGGNTGDSLSDSAKEIRGASGS